MPLLNLEGLQFEGAVEGEERHWSGGFQVLLLVRWLCCGSVVWVPGVWRRGLGVHIMP